MPPAKAKGGKLGKIGGKGGAKRLTTKAIKNTILGITKPAIEDSPEEVVSRESALSSMTRPELSSEASSRTLSRTPSPTLSTPRERLLPPLMSSTPSRDKAELYTGSEAEN